MTEVNSNETKDKAAAQIFRSATISKGREENLNYNISVQLNNGQYDWDLDSLKKIRGQVSPTYNSKEWHFTGVQFRQDEDANGVIVDKSELDRRLAELDLTIHDVAKAYYHRALLAGIA